MKNREVKKLQELKQKEKEQEKEKEKENQLAMLDDQIMRENNTGINNFNKESSNPTNKRKNADDKRKS